MAVTKTRRGNREITKTKYEMINTRAKVSYKRNGDKNGSKINNRSKNRGPKNKMPQKLNTQENKSPRNTNVPEIQGRLMKAKGKSLQKQLNY